MTELRRSLGLLDATMVNVGVIIGSAVFLTASDVARALPHPLLQLGTWVVAALFSLAPDCVWESSLCEPTGFGLLLKSRSESSRPPYSG